MALLVLLVCRELVGFASHSSGDPLITNDVLYQLSYSGPATRGYSTGRAIGKALFFGRRRRGFLDDFRVRDIALTGLGGFGAVVGLVLDRTNDKRQHLQPRRGVHGTGRW